MNGNDLLNNRLDRHTDPVVNFFGNHNTCRFAGSCKPLNVGGNNNTIMVDSAATLTISVNHNTIVATATDQVGVSGRANTIHYRHAIRARKKPAVLDRGDHNQIKQK